VIKNFWVGLAALLLAQCSFAQWIPFDVKAGENRPFLIANRNGTYLYGSTGDDWDQGWMGLWVNRERVAGQIEPRLALRLHVHGRDSEFQIKGERVFAGAMCDVRPESVLWTWQDREYLELWFQPDCDTVFWTASLSVGLNADTTWFVFVPERSGVIDTASSIQTSAENLNAAIQWTDAQLQNLLAENDSLLYAGIPWFNEGWGRDTFISLPGLLVTGHYDAAKKLLMRFAGWIDRDPNSPTYGRIPNRVRPGEEIVYNTADGTPWWMREVYEYGIYSGDYALWDTLMSDSGAMRIALDAAVAKSDSFGFLMHGDADTWMDAVGPDGPHTPRGNRAIEIQALHFTCLDNAQRMTHKPNPKWKETAEKIRKNFLAEYFAPSQDHFYDRLMADGTPDTTMRPNQMFAFTAPYTPLVPPQIEATVTKKIASELFYEHGVLSLSPQDTCFHPFHQDWHYPKDDAYHQGVVWVWNSGPAKTLLIREGRGDLALKMMEYEAWHMRERGMVGSLPELFDAVKRPGAKDIAWSGTSSQAWSLAEFLRATYQDFLGIRPVVYQRVDPFWLFAPRIPESWGQVETTVNCSGTPLRVKMQQFADSTVVEVAALETPKYALPVKFFDAARGITGEINTTDPVRVVYRKKDGYMLYNGQPTSQKMLTGWPYDKGSARSRVRPADQEA
jgi:glycogen debranching enzyme